MTPKQRELYDFVAGWINAKGYAPSYREMGAAVRVAPPRIHALIYELKAQGKITSEYGRRRSIEIVKPNVVQLRPEIMALTDRYARSHGISRETAANELLRAALEAA